ncbi:MAG: hypothetical protein ACRDZ7_07555 [Acidimicrobiia bacterium]
MRRFRRLGPVPFLVLFLACAEAPCRVCFAVSGVVDRAGGEPISCAA